MSIRNFRMTQGDGALEVDGTEVSRHRTDYIEAAFRALEGGATNVVFYPEPIRFEGELLTEELTEPPVEEPEPEEPPVEPEPPSGEHFRNQPAGWEVVVDYGFSDEPPTASKYENQPLGPFKALDWGRDGGHMRRVSDPSAPVSAPYVLEQPYPAGLSGSGTTELDLGFSSTDRLYVSWVVKWDADFEHNNTSEKWLYFNFGDSDYLLFQLHYGDESIYRLTSPKAEDDYGTDHVYANMKPYGVHEGTWHRRPVARPLDGEWVEYELLFEGGAVKWWRNGVPHAHHEGLTLPTFRSIRIGTTWGGGGNKSGTQSRYIDHVRIAA